MGREDAAVRLVLLVDDYDRAIDFYCKQTGLFSIDVDFELGPKERNVVLGYNNPRSPFYLVPRRAITAKTRASIGQQAGDFPFFVLPVDDCLRSYDLLQNAGVQFADELAELPYGCQATLLDPFGNRVCLFQYY